MGFEACAAGRAGPRLNEIEPGGCGAPTDSHETPPRPQFVVHTASSIGRGGSDGESRSIERSEATGDANHNVQPARDRDVQRARLLFVRSSSLWNPWMLLETKECLRVYVMAKD